MKLKEVIKKIENEFPIALAAKWDFPGLQYGKNKFEVKKIMICLDLTTAVLNDAISNKIDLIISHHPFLFNEKIKKIKLKYKNKIIEQLQKHQIAIYGLHTQYDSSKKGMNSKILDDLKCEDVKSYRNINFIKYGKLPEEINFDDLIVKLKTIFNIPYVQFLNWDNEQKIKKIAICAGAGGDLINKIKSDEIDVFITGEMKWNDWILSYENKNSVIVLNHFMENYFTNDMDIILKKIFLKDDISIKKHDIKSPIIYK
ncbi:Nif3-like dinuclear metal center hexameric protein [Spiroplasma endosymbiont of Amphibalanus improvisus]|uniref:Nif3-like dinuclear metal center hexameric protein n=1 Tax=Spiroplasma endosymbiont of Amphibalanus improvisus TaxID=3066327 RepID=UPI00313DEFA4